MSPFRPQFSYAYDLAGRVTTAAGTKATGGPEYRTYAYDGAGQLTAEAVTGGATTTHGYDPNGNRTTGGVLTIAGNRLAEDADDRYAYDNLGYLIRREAKASTKVREFAYDHRDRLVAVADRDSPAGPVTKATTYTYDAFDRRVAKALDPDGTGPAAPVRSFTAHDGVEVLADLDATGTITRRYLHGPAVDQVLARLDGAGAVDWYLADRLGSVRALARIGPGPAAVLDRVDYDAFGNTVAETNPAAGDRFKFTARELDSETGLYYYRARYYDPASGRFLAQDPAGFAAGDPNLYRYVGNSPTNATDPSGLQAQPSTGGGGGGGTPVRTRPTPINGIADNRVIDGGPSSRIRGSTGGGMIAGLGDFWNSYNPIYGRDLPIPNFSDVAFLFQEPGAYLRGGLMGAEQGSNNLTQGIRATAWDLGAVPYDGLRIIADTLFYDTGHQEVSHFGRSSRDAQQAGVEYAQIGSKAVVNFLTLGGYGYGEAFVQYAQTGDPRALQENAGGVLVGALTAYGLQRATQALGPKAAPAEPAPAASINLEASAIRHSQSNVRATLPEIVQSMKAEGWQGPPIDVVRMADGGLTAVDNTRLAAANLTRTPVRANIRGATEAFPSSRGPQYFRGPSGHPATWGEAILNRISRQHPLWRKLYPNGSPMTGVHPSTPGFTQ